jgi:methylated-DNA-[protein]-cysteine S-methyltransferase
MKDKFAQDNDNIPRGDETVFDYVFPRFTLAFRAKGDALTGISFGKAAAAPRRESAVIAAAYRQIQEYLQKERKKFDIPFVFCGTEFQEAVWNALLKIPYGETRSYKEIAVSIGREKASRAVGMAVHNNPCAILIPCHRVIGSNGDLTGFAGGLDVKKILLNLERCPN